MKNFILPVLLIVSTITMAINPPSPQFFAEGQQLYVVAESGLNLRSEPSASAPILKKIYYGEMVTILYTPDSCVVKQEIEWVEGEWIEIDYDGMGGYVFSGYLSPLIVPDAEYDTAEELTSLSSSLESYARIHLHLASNPDSTSNEYSHSVTHRFEGGEKMVQTFYDYGYKTELTLKGIRVMDAYHLLKGMINSKDDRQGLVENSVFIRDRAGDLGIVKVFTDDYIKIKKLKSGDIQISIVDNYTGGC